MTKTQCNWLNSYRTSVRVDSETMSLSKSNILYLCILFASTIAGLKHQVRRIITNRMSNDSTSEVSVIMRHVLVTPEDRRNNDTLEAPVTSTELPCSTLKPPVFPFPPNLPPPCESDGLFYASPFFCHTAKKPLLVILILSYVGNFKQRQELRREWVRSTFHMKSDFIAAHPWSYVFVVGRPTGNDKETAEVMKSVDVERCHYKDVLTVDVLENYYNLTWKKMDALEYLVKSDLDFEVVLKTDDDVYVNIQLVLEWLPDALSQAYEKINSSVRPFYSGNCPLSSSPIRESSSKWYLSPKHYPPKRLPPFCFGTAYFLSQDLIKTMLKLRDLKKTFRLEDVHTGLLVGDTGLVPTNHIINNTRRIYNYEPGRCGGRSYNYPFAVMRSRPTFSRSRYNYYSEFMRSLCRKYSFYKGKSYRVN